MKKVRKVLSKWKDIVFCCFFLFNLPLAHIFVKMHRQASNARKMKAIAVGWRESEQQPKNEQEKNCSEEQKPWRGETIKKYNLFPHDVWYGLYSQIVADDDFQFTLTHSNSCTAQTWQRKRQWECTSNEKNPSILWFKYFSCCCKKSSGTNQLKLMLFTVCIQRFVIFYLSLSPLCLFVIWVGMLVFVLLPQKLKFTMVEISDSMQKLLHFAFII